MTILVPMRSGEATSELALEAGMGLGDEIVAVTIGSEQNAAMLRSAVAAGADRAIRIACAAGVTTSGVDDAVALAPLVAELQPELVLIGGRRGKFGTHGTGAALAELSGYAHIGSISRVCDLQDDRVVVQRRRESDLETISARLPAVLSIEWGVPLRYPTLPGRLRARRIEIEGRASPPQTGEAQVSVTRRTGPKPRRKLEQRTGPGFGHVLEMLLGGAGGGGGATQLSGNLDEVAAQVVAACTSALQRA